MKKTTALKMVFDLAKALNALIEKFGGRPISMRFGTVDLRELRTDARHMYRMTGLPFEDYKMSDEEVARMMARLSA